MVKELACKQHPDMFIILEPHCQFSQASKFWEKLDFLLLVISEANEHSSGIWLLGVRRIQFSVVDCFSQAVSIKVGMGSS